MGDSLALTLASKKATDLHRDMRRYATTFQMTNTSTTKDAAKALRAFKKAARQSTANSLLAGRESIIPTITKSNDEDYNNQDDVNSDNNRVYQINQQLKGGVETEAAKPEELPIRVTTRSQKKKVSHIAIAFSSCVQI